MGRNLLFEEFWNIIGNDVTIYVMGAYCGTWKLSDKPNYQDRNINQSNQCLIQWDVILVIIIRIPIIMEEKRY